MKINQHKLKRQNRVIEKWSLNKGKGTLEAVTGFGKTYVAVLVIQDMNKRKPDRDTIVVVPTLYLKKQWEDIITNMNLKNVTVMVVNTAIKKNVTCSLLVLDEIHNYASTRFKGIFRVIKYNFILGLTATMERKDNNHILLEHYAPIIDTIDMKEAIENSYVSNFRIFNLGIEMSAKDALEYKSIGDKFYKFFSMFGHDFNTAMRCLSDPSYRKMYAEKMGWEEKETYFFAIAFNRNMQLRKKFLYYAQSKVDVAAELIKIFDVPTITFSEATEFADSLSIKSPKHCLSYHSKLKAKEKRIVMERFSDPQDKIRVINTAKSLDEGFDISGIELAIICSGTSSERQDLQRTGRAIRYSDGKLGMIINLYIKNTQDEKWLKARQKKNENIVYVKNIDEINEIVNDLKLTL